MGCGLCALRQSHLKNYKTQFRNLSIRKYKEISMRRGYEAAAAEKGKGWLLASRDFADEVCLDRF